MLIPLLEFVKFTHLFQKVSRVVLVPGEERWENDMEHSYQLAMVAWYLIEQGGLSYNVEKVLGYALVHDLVEAHAGDTYIYASAADLASKLQREHEAAELLKKQFPEFPSLHRYIHEYEQRETPESRFVYALDKLLPILNIYIDEGRTWQRTNLGLEQLLKAKTEKIGLSEDVVPYYNEIVEILGQNAEAFFSASATASSAQ